MERLKFNFDKEKKQFFYIEKKKKHFLSKKQMLHIIKQFRKDKNVEVAKVRDNYTINIYQNPKRVRRRNQRKTKDGKIITNPVSGITHPAISRFEQAVIPHYTPDKLVTDRDVKHYYLRKELERTIDPRYILPALSVDPFMSQEKNRLEELERKIRAIESDPTIKESIETKAKEIVEKRLALPPQVVPEIEAEPSPVQQTEEPPDISPPSSIPRKQTPARTPTRTPIGYIRCPVEACGKIYKNVESLRSHIRLQHPEISPSIRNGMIKNLRETKTHIEQVRR